MSKEVISARLQQDVVKKIEEIASQEKVDKTTILGRAVDQYIQEYTKQKALNLYREGTITLSRASEIAGITLWQMFDEIQKNKMPYQYDEADLEDDLKALDDE